VAKETATNFSNFRDTVRSVKNMQAWKDGETFKPEFPWAAEWAKLDDVLSSRVPYYSWGIGEGTFKLLKFEPATGAESKGRSSASVGEDVAPQSGEAAKARGREILENYFKGQRWLIVSFAMYYSLFSPVANALGGEEAVGSGRSGYAGALASLSPLAGVLVERFSVRTILRACSAARAIIWAGLVPAAYFAFGPTALFATAFAALMFADGAVVTVNTLVDIDENGVDFLAQQHAFPIDDQLRNEFNARLERTYSVSRIVLPPIMAGLGIFAAAILNSAGLALMGIMAASFAIPSGLSLYYYSKIPAEAKLPPRSSGKSIGAEVKQIASDFWGGVKTSWNNRKIRYRFLQYALERAREDAMLLVVLAEYGIRVLAHGDKAWGALYTASLISLGKIGAWVASHLMEHRWKAPKTKEDRWGAYRVFFPLAFAGAAATLLVPAAVSFVAQPWIGAAIVAGASFLFNLFCTGSSLGFRNLMQGIANEEGAAGRIFGIQNTFLMATNALAIGGLSAVFAATGISTAFWIACGLFAAIGAFELFVAPKLLFSKAERTAKKGDTPSNTN
jgi:hypothetical protein